MLSKKTLLGAALALIATQAAADDCQLKQYASLDLIVDNEKVLVPVTLGGRPGGYFILDFDAIVSGIAESASDALQLKRSAMKSSVHINLDGKDIREQVFAPTQLGGVKGDIVMAVIPKFRRDDIRIVGVLGIDLLGKFDVELDIAHSKLNLFSPDHCKGQVVHWTHSAAVAAVAMETHDLETFGIPMQLDGKDIEAAFSVMPKPVISSRVAHDRYGLDTTPGATGEMPVHKFQTLSVDGLTIANPELAIYPADTRACDGGVFTERASRTIKDADPFMMQGRKVEARRLDSIAGTRCFGLPDMTIGLPELRNLHVYIAFREHMVYITAAGAN
jgi:hypothetical protein